MMTRAVASTQCPMPVREPLDETSHNTMRFNKLRWMPGHFLLGASPLAMKPLLMRDIIEYFITEYQSSVLGPKMASPMLLSRGNRRMK